MKTLPLASIAISDNRQRKTFTPEDIQEFADKILERGLLHAIILRENEGKLTLVAGERRVRAISALHAMGEAIRHDDQPVPPGEIPYTLLSELDELSAEEAELEENTCRKDLSWQEHVEAMARLQALRTKQAELKGLPPPTTADISEETKGKRGSSQFNQTRKELLIAKHLDKAEVAGAKNLDEAFKELKRIEVKERSQALGQLVGKDFSAAQHKCINADCREWMKECADGIIDVILTDPPYGMNADQFNNSGGVGNVRTHDYADTREYHAALTKRCAADFFRITKPEAHLYWFCDFDLFAEDRDCFIDEGWNVFRTPFIWHKPHASRAPWPYTGPQRKYEMILYAVKGEKKANHIAGDVLSYSADPQMNHPAQKPVALYKDLLSRSVLPGDVVFDPFCGTGPIFPAAQELLCAAIGIEKDPVSYGKAVARIQELK